MDEGAALSSSINSTALTICSASLEILEVKTNKSLDKMEIFYTLLSHVLIYTSCNL